MPTYNLSDNVIKFYHDNIGTYTTDNQDSGTIRIDNSNATTSHQDITADGSVMTSRVAGASFLILIINKNSGLHSWLKRCFDDFRVMSIEFLGENRQITPKNYIDKGKLVEWTFYY